jgi:hypothetical protein
MQILQQKQFLQTAIVLPVTIVSIVIVGMILSLASVALGLGALAAWHFCLTVYLRNHIITYLSAATLSYGILLAVLFPASQIITFL